MDRDDVEILDCETLYKGHTTLSKYTIRHRRFDGGWTPEFTREMLSRAPAVCVLPYDPVRDEVILIEQFRVGAYEGGLMPWQTEIVAGIIDTDESEEQVGRREMVEEAGCEASDMHFVCKGLSSSGLLSEVCSIYIGIVNTADAGGVHGLDEEHEDIRAVTYSFEDAIKLMADGKFQHLHGIIALQWLAANRERLRKEYGEKRK